MSDVLQIAATKRDVAGRAALNELRSQGKIPAVLYGHNVETVSLTVDATAFEKLFAAAGESTVIAVNIDGDVRNVLVHDVQRDPVKYRISHVDLYQVNMNEEISAEVELLFEGEAPAEKALGGVLVKSISHIAVRALPQNLPHHIVVDVTKLATFEDHIRVSDLVVPENVVIEHEMNDTVALVTPPRSEAELEALNEEVVENVDSVEVSTAKKPEEGEEAAE